VFLGLRGSGEDADPDQLNMGETVYGAYQSFERNARAAGIAVTGIGLDESEYPAIPVVPPEVLARSTWTAGCPVRRERLGYLRVSFWGFDDRPHTGEMVVRADVAQAVVQVFSQLFEARYPIEEMRVVPLAELTLPRPAMATTQRGSSVAGRVDRLDSPLTREDSRSTSTHSITRSTALAWCCLRWLLPTATGTPRGPA
jgi:hypothetical protein